MSRFLLDTNIMVFFLLGEESEISKETSNIVTDYENQLYTSSVVVVELLQLFRLKKIKSKKYKTAVDLVSAIEQEYSIEILPFTSQHTETLARLEIADGHNDPFDHSIVSHAIAERLTLVSSDRQFKNYTGQKLNFVFNRR